MEHVSKFSLKDILKDRITGYKGEVTSIAFYATGCTHYGISPLKLDKDGKIMDYTWLDESRLVLVKSAVSENKEKRGGPECNPPSI
jgi:hypothetical protein